MNDINRINIGGRSFNVTGGRLFSPQTLAKGAVSFVRYGGPAWLGFMLAGLVWDEVTQRWLKPGEATEYDGLYTHANVGWGIGCTSAPGCTIEDINQRILDYYEADSPATYDFWVGSITPEAGGSYKVYFRYSINGSGDYSKSTQRYNRVGNPPMDTEATDQELEDAIYTELVARGMGSDLARRLIEAGYNPPVDSIDIDGPTSVPGPTTTTTTTGTSGNTTTTTNTTYNISYNTTNNYSTVTITTTNTTTAPDGTTTTTTEAPPEGGEQTQEEQYTLTYSPSTMPEVPDFYEQKYPDGFAGAWNDFKGRVTASSLAGFINGIGSGLPGGGTCPSWSMSLNMGAMGNFGTFVLEPPCVIWPFIKAVMILSALFVARRLVVGG